MGANVGMTLGIVLSGQASFITHFIFTALVCEHWPSQKSQSEKVLQVISTQHHEAAFVSIPSSQSQVSRLSEPGVARMAFQEGIS